MPQIKKPIDDNTLFILLALRQNKQIEIPNVQAVYDFEVNYDNTAIVEGRKYPQNIDEIAAAGIDFVVDNYGVAKAELEDGTIILTVQNTQHIADYLSEYLQDFPHDTRYYYDEARHRKQLHEFIKSKVQIINDFSEKYFTYKLLPESDKEKYKMIEYIAWLIEQGFILSDNNTFCFDHEGEDLKKVIFLQFASVLKAKELFLNELSADEQQRVKEELLNKTPVAESENWQLFDEKVQDNILYKSNNLYGHISPRFHKIIRFAIECGNGAEITPQDYIKYSKNKELNSEQAVKTYFADAEKQIAKELCITKPIIFHSLGNKRWRIRV